MLIVLIFVSLQIFVLMNLIRITESRFHSKVPFRFRNIRKLLDHTVFVMQFRRTCGDCGKHHTIIVRPLDCLFTLNARKKHAECYYSAVVYVAVGYCLRRTRPPTLWLCVAPGISPFERFDGVHRSIALLRVVNVFSLNVVVMAIA